MNNITWMDNITNPADMFYHINNSSSGILCITIMIASAVIIFVSMRYENKDLDEILIYCGGLKFILAVLFIVWKQLAVYWLMLPIGILFAGIILSRLRNKG